MDTQNFLEWMADKFIDDGFFVRISVSNDYNINFHVTLPDYPSYQTTRTIPDNMSPIEMGSLYFDISTSIRRLERYAENRHQRMA